jgi:hypothetical protein
LASLRTAIRKVGVHHAGVPENRPGQVGARAEQAVEARAAQVRAGELDPLQDRGAVVDRLQVALAVVDQHEAAADVGFLQDGVLQIDAAQDGAAQVRPRQVTVAEVGAREAGGEEIGGHQPGAVEHATFQVRAYQVGMAEVAALEVQATCVGEAEGEPLAAIDSLQETLMGFQDLVEIVLGDALRLVDLRRPGGPVQPRIAILVHGGLRRSRARWVRGCGMLNPLCVAKPEDIVPAPSVAPGLFHDSRKHNELGCLTGP